MDYVFHVHIVWWFVFVNFFDRSFSEGLVLLPVAVISIPLTKWGIRWQNERYIRSAQNQDDIEIVKERLDAIEERIKKLEEK